MKNFDDDKWLTELLPFLGEEIAVVAEDLTYALDQITPGAGAPVSPCPQTLKQLRKLCGNCAGFAAAVSAPDTVKGCLSWDLIDDWAETTQFALENLQRAVVEAREDAPPEVLALIAATEALLHECQAAQEVNSREYARSTPTVPAAATYTPPRVMSRSEARARTISNNKSESWVSKQEKWDFI